LAAMTSSSSKDIDFEQETEFALLRAKAAEAAKLEAEADMVGERVVTERENRRLPFGIAIAALVLMVLQVLVANGIFGWYGVAAN
jgi:hypothetical protein